MDTELDAVYYAVSLDIINRKFDEAYELCEPAYKLNKDYFNLPMAQCLLTQGKVEKAEKLFIKEFEKGNKHAFEFYLTEIFNAENFLKYKAKIEKYASSALKLRFCVGNYALGKLAFENKEFEKAYNLFRTCMNTEWPSTYMGYVLLNMGIMWWDGNYVNKDRKRAVKLFEMGASSGSEYCRAFVGRAYLDGEGVEKNVGKAIYEFTCGAMDGDQICLEELVSFYKKRIKNPIDNKKIYKKWLFKLLHHDSPMGYYFYGIDMLTGYFDKPNRTEATKAFVWLSTSDHHNRDKYIEFLIDFKNRHKDKYGRYFENLNREFHIFKEQNIES